MKRQRRLPPATVHAPHAPRARLPPLPVCPHVPLGRRAQPERVRLRPAAPSPIVCAAYVGRTPGLLTTTVPRAWRRRFAPVCSGSPRHPPQPVIARARRLAIALPASTRLRHLPPRRTVYAATSMTALLAGTRQPLPVPLRTARARTVSPVPSSKMRVIMLPVPPGRPAPLARASPWRAVPLSTAPVLTVA